MIHYKRDLLEEYGRLRVHPDTVSSLSNVDIERHLAKCEKCLLVVGQAQRQQEERESIKGMIRTAYDLMLPKVDEFIVDAFITHLTDVFMAKLARDAQASFGGLDDALDGLLAKTRELRQDIVGKPRRSGSIPPD